MTIFVGVANPIMEAAFQYASNFWQVFPCKRDKKPFTLNGQDAATIDLKTIEGWWSKWPDANIGIHCENSGIIVVDVDRVKGADINDLLSIPGTDPISLNTYRVATGGGEHLYYNFPHGSGIKNSQSRIAPHIDIRSNGYVIAPPSVHQNGSQYRVVSDVPLLDFPKAWIKKLCDSPFFVQPPIYSHHEDRHEELVRRIKTIGKQNRSGNTDAKCPAHSGQGSTSLFLSANGLVVACLRGCDYHAILRSFGLPDNRLPKRPQAQSAPNPTVPPIFVSQPQLLDQTLRPVDPIKDENLPSVLVNWLRPAARVIGCPFDFLVLSAIATAGGLIGSRLRVKPLENSDWCVVPNLYVGLVGRVSAKKTPALDEIRRVNLELQLAARKEYEAKKEDYDIEIKFYEKQSAALLKNQKSAAAYKTQLAYLSKPERPIMRRYETNDITTPKLVQFLAENPNGLIQFRDELTAWLNSLEADYDKSARAFYLELSKGAITHELARVGTGEIPISSGTLSIIGGIQPTKIQKYVSEAYSDNNADGLLQRFLLTYPDSVKRSGKPTPSDQDSLRIGYARANVILKKLAEFDFRGKTIGPNGDVFQTVKLSQDAQYVADLWMDEMAREAEQIEPRDEPFSSYLHKLPKSCFAIALIFHCFENVEGPVFPDLVSADTMLKAIGYTDVLVSHARRVFSLGENRVFDLARTLIGKIKEGRVPQGFTLREIKRNGWGDFKKEELIDDVLGLLIDYGYLIPQDTVGKGRQTTRYYYHESLEPEPKDDDTI